MTGRGRASRRVLVFHAAAGFVHESTDAGLAAVTSVCDLLGADALATDDPDTLVTAIPGTAVVVVLQSTGDVLPGREHRAALERHVRGGGGFVGLHAASAMADDVHVSWPWFHALVGARFKGHTRTGSEPAVLRVEDPASPAACGLVDGMVVADEWYGFHDDPRANGVHVVATVDESSYDPHAGAMGDDHPVVWWHRSLGGTSVYNALGHDTARWSEPWFRESIRGAIEMAIPMLSK